VRRLNALALITLVVLMPRTNTAQDAKAVVTAARKAMGAENLKTIEFSGMGSIAQVGQNKSPRAAWPLSRLKTYTRQLDLTRHPDKSAWNDQFDFWLTPFGFLKGAIENVATVRSDIIDETRYSVVAYSLQNKYRVVGYINEENMVSRVQTWIDNDVLGDMLVEVSYTVYKDFGGVKFPTTIIQNHGGFPVLILSVNAVKANAAAATQDPPPDSPAAAQTTTVQAEKVSEGIYYLKGGTHHSVAVEFRDYIAVIEAPLNEQRSVAVIAELKKVIPGKPIRYLINTHHHFDHSGGLRAYVNEGVTIVTQQINKEFFEKAFSARRSLNPDRLEQSRRKANIETVADKRVISDAGRSLELHLIKDSPHNDGILLAFLPKEKIVIEADVYTPSTTNAAPNPAAVNLVENLERLRLDFETILPLHGLARATRAGLYAAIQKPVPDMAELLKAPPPTAQVEGQRGQRGQRGQAPATDPAAQLLSSACAGCHSLARIESKKADEDEWAVVVERMKGKGAELSDEDTRTLIQYLGRTYR